MDYEITQAKTQDELREIADMMAKVFASRSYFDFHATRAAYQNRDPFYKPEFSRIAKFNGRIVSHVSVVEKHLRIGSAVVKVGGIGDVFTHPEHRGKHLTHILMEDSIRYMAANRFPLSMLYGIMNFYHKFGYIEAVNAYKTLVALKNLAALPPAPDKAVRPFRDADLPKLNALYNKAFAGKTLSAERIPEVWFPIAKPKTTFVAVDRRDNPVGYVVTSAPPTAPSLAFHVKEAVAFDAPTAALLTAYLRDRARELYLAELEFHQRPDSWFIGYLEDFGATHSIRLHAEGEGQGMLRIVLLKDLFEDLREELSRRFLAAADAPDALEIAFKTDVGQVALRGGKRGIVVADKPAKGAVIIKTPQNALTRLVIGHAGVERFLRRVGKENLAEKPRRLLEILFPAATPYLCEGDYF